MIAIRRYFAGPYSDDSSTNAFLNFSNVDDNG